MNDKPLTQILNARCVISDELVDADLSLRGRHITGIKHRSSARNGNAGLVIDGSGLICAPGLIDLQVNGGFGFDLASQPEAIAAVAERLPRHGVTAWLPTLVTSPAETYDAMIDAVQAPVAPRSARPLGLHLEGPVLARDCKGAHAEQHLLSPAVLLDGGCGNLLERLDHVAMMTLAPELPGAMELIEYLFDHGVLVAAGHTNATTADIDRAVDAGVRYVTHLFNAMRPFHHRDPGVAGAALTDRRLIAGLIVDGVHLAPETVRLAWQALGADRCNLISDATAAFDAPGPAQLGDVAIAAATSDGSVRTVDGALAGTTIGLGDALRNLSAITGASPVDALATATRVPAELLGLKDRGWIAPDFVADLVLLTSQLTPVATITEGQLAWCAPDEAWRVPGA